MNQIENPIKSNWLHLLFSKPFSARVELDEKELKLNMNKIIFCSGEIVIGASIIELKLEETYSFIRGKLFVPDEKFRELKFIDKIKCISEIVKNRKNEHYMTNEQWENIEKKLILIKDVRNFVAHGFNDKFSIDEITKSTINFLRQEVIDIIKIF